MGLVFPDFLYEGTIKHVDYNKGTCKVSVQSSRADTEITEVPIPDWAGSGNAGFWMGNLKEGSRVVIANLSGEGREFSIIVARLPQLNKFYDTFNANRPTSTPVGTLSYPDMAEGRVILAGENGSYLRLNENGDVNITAGGNGAGHYLKKFGLKSVAEYQVTQEKSSFSNGGRSYSGTVRRLISNLRTTFPKTNPNEAPLFVDLEFHNVGLPIGFFNGSKPFKYSIESRKRNPEISENRTVINEFSTDSIFTGFDDEILRYKDQKKLLDQSEFSDRTREPSNTLQLAEHELIEVVGGNLVDFKGNILDLNYQKLFYGSSGNRVPSTTKDIAKEYESARRISRRGIGFHFMLATNTTTRERSTSNNSLLVDIDKEGLLKLNVPKNTDTGNIPFPGTTTFRDDSGNVSTEISNQSVQELIPVTLRDKEGTVVLPKTYPGSVYRETGIRYDNSIPYFPGNSEDGAPNTIRVNSTKYHNMYSIAERLIANNITKINIPQIFTNDQGYVDGLAIGKPFEILDDEETSTENILELDANQFKLPGYMGTVTVYPDPPAIYSGGGTVVAGKDYTDENYPPYSNAFELTQDNNETVTVSQDNQKTGGTGGKSAYLNFEGSVESSIGADNSDRKSLVLDTAGSLLAWFGKDKNGRSVVMQTDGEMLVNVGGTYNQDGTTMNTGKFVLRVNVSDKGHLDTETNSNLGANSDFVISIGEEGLVIAGMKQGAPMIFRNSGKILIESETDLVLKGSKVEQVDAKGKSTTPSVSGRG